MSEDQDSFDYIFKVVLVGNSGVGKSNLFTRFTRNMFHSDTMPTIGLDFDTKTIKIDGKTIRTQIWDTAGQERFKALASTYYRGALGALIVYDITDRQSFDEAQRLWLRELQQYADKNVTAMLVGNKCDLNHLRVVSQEEAHSLAVSNQLCFIETSALDSTNVEAAFNNIITEIYRHVTSERSIGEVSWHDSMGRGQRPPSITENSSISKCCRQ